MGAAQAQVLVPRNGRGHCRPQATEAAGSTESGLGSEPLPRASSLSLARAQARVPAAIPHKLTYQRVDGPPIVLGDPFLDLDVQGLQHTVDVVDEGLQLLHRSAVWGEEGDRQTLAASISLNGGQQTGSGRRPAPWGFLLPGLLREECAVTQKGPGPGGGI